MWAGTCAPLQVQPMALRSCLNNLIDNALRYAGSARVELEDSREALTIRLIDHGPGLPPTSARRCSKPFYRLEGSRNRNSGGVGLGNDHRQGRGGTPGRTVEPRGNPGRWVDCRDVVAPRLTANAVQLPINLGHSATAVRLRGGSGPGSRSNPSAGLYATASKVGPINRPMKPNAIRPPNTPSNTITSGRLPPRLIRYGLSTLSTPLMMNVPHTPRNTA